MFCTEIQDDQNTDRQITFVELSFEIIGQTLPSDHGYGLYSAIARRCPTVHEQDGISISTIAGERDYQGKIHLSKGAQLRIRLPYDANQIAQILPLAGQTLRIGTHEIQLGIPQIFPLRPFDKLRSRIVTIKKFQDPEPFLDAVKRQMDALEIIGNVYIPLDIDGNPLRKAIKIKKYSVVGFSVAITELSDEHSLKLQAWGLGGKRRMGCGVFSPFPGAWRFKDV
ncbi:type I-MYXAN CRISPR-associated protein Cas6/Cmx6 [filamentous cyanobacterium LEGE 11480]|uniref:Type I-MYXAN CRISPR-associated protein Cas6/Cmx6 n=1 Tax=Romeriopsis navalis LEGE 11480 TaxID=2777977 RepID=A0A928Z2V4_9CYAN|nr:type I-MYXAN CRISPR-associated protein Cas6/Cmx6 [Romeriopsis navalis]MBE9028730.1 type I-MYXAN CRISPR-associated protein Cas6/Cmx6 [Romeriopsis navalis LEGE 11480]